MKEYQAVVLRLSRHLRDDEDALTDLLNERSRGGWEPTMMAQDAQRLTIVFARETATEATDSSTLAGAADTDLVNFVERQR